MSEAGYDGDSSSSEASPAGEESIADASTVSGSSTADEDSASDAETTLTRVTFGVPSAAEDHTDWEHGVYTAGIEQRRSCLRDPHRNVARPKANPHNEALADLRLGRFGIYRMVKPEIIEYQWGSKADTWVKVGSGKDGLDGEERK